MSVHLEIDEQILEKFKKEAKKLAKERDEDEEQNLILFDDLKLDYDVEETPSYNEKTNELELYGSLMQKDEKLGWLSINFKLDFDLVIEIIEAYRKRLGKLKTVLEATK